MRTLFQPYQLSFQSFVNTVTVTLWLFFFLNTLPAQTSFQNPVIINTSNGLPSNRIHAIKQDNQGFMWIATDKGLARYDGLSVQTFNKNDEDSTSIASDFIHDVLPLPENDFVWVAHSRGVSLFNRRTWVFTNFQHNPNDPHGIPDHQAYRLHRDKEGQIWIGLRSEGLARYRPETNDFQRYLHASDEKTDFTKYNFTITEIEDDLHNDSIFWLGTHAGLLRFNKLTGNYEHFFYEMEDDKSKTYANSIRRMLVHPNGKVYYGTWYVGIKVFDINTQTYSPLDPCYSNNSFSLENDVTQGFYQKSSSEFWINSVKGLQLYDTRTRCITATYQNKKGKKFGIGLMDREGRAWYGTTDEGIYIFNPLIQQYDFKYYEEEDSEFPSYATKIIEDTLRQKIYVSTSLSKGLYILDQKSGQWECIQPPIGFFTKSRNSFQGRDAVLMDNGNLLIVGEQKLYLYRQGQKRLQLYPVQPTSGFPQLQRVIKDKEGHYWITSYRAGLMRLDANKKELVEIDRSRLERAWNKSIGGDNLAEDKNGNIWMREHDGLLIYVKAADSLLYHPYDPADLRAYRGMSGFQADDQGGMWIGTQRDFLGYGHADSIEQGILHFYGKKEGLQGDHVRFAKPYKNKILVFTEIGMQYFNPISKRFEKYYDGSYGLGENVSNATILSDGKLAVGREKSIALFHPDSLLTNAELPQPYISSFSIFDNNYPIFQGPFYKLRSFLSYKENFFSMEFSAIGYNLPERTQFRYMLEGFDEKWQDGTKRRFAAYTNVPGGEYQFKVEAINSEGLSSGEPFNMNINISTVWWKRGWFWAALTAFLLGLSYLVYRWRINQVRKEERVRAEYERKLADVEMSALRAQMNPHFIFNCLNSIDYYIISNEQEKASDYLNRFSRLIRLILQNSKSTIVPLKDDLEALKLYIEMESLRFDGLFDYEVKMEKDIDPDSLKVPPMLMQPYVENAIWHGLMQKKGEKGKLDLTLRRSNGHLVCLIEDNGIGRGKAQLLKSKSAPKRKSYGMKITSDRLAMLNKLAGADASVQIFDLKKENGTAAGTRVELVIPL